MIKKYPIGTKIRFLNFHLDTNKTGIIVALQQHGDPVVYLPTADKHLIENRFPTYKGIKFTWKCSWHEIEPLKNVQLEFKFMSQNA